MPDGLDLQPGPDRDAEIDTLVASLGGRVGLGGVLGDLDRRARRLPVPGSAVSWGYALGVRDLVTPRWWPQGITTSADACPDEQVAGRSVVVTSSYSKVVRGGCHGARLTFFDVTDLKRVRYRHVLLVDVAVASGHPTLQPVRVHAGGLVWHRDHVHVAATARGLVSFRVDDIVRLTSGTAEGFGYRYVLPLRMRYSAVGAENRTSMRYSFISLAREGGARRLLAGEYGRGRQTTRLTSYDLDPGSGLLRADQDGRCRPTSVEESGIPGMQGAAWVDGRLYVTQSHGRGRRGSLWVGRPGELTPYDGALPPGPEDLCYWPSRDQLWSVSEHPPLRFVFGFDRGRLG